METEMVRVASKGGVRIIGPNCMGTYSPASGVGFTIAASKISGPVGCLSQSGGHALALIETSPSRGIYFSKAAYILAL